MIRRDFLRRVVYGGTALAATGGAGKAFELLPKKDCLPGSSAANLSFADAQEKTALPSLSAAPFALEDVRILDPALLRMREQTLNYMLALDSDRLLHNFRVNAGL